MLNRTLRSRAIAATSFALAALMLSACVPEPAESPSTSSPSSSASATSPSSSPAPSPTSNSEGIVLPTDCQGVYSPGMRASLEEANPPLNDPGVTMLSTQDAALLEMLDTVPNIRCSWGAPSETGLATTVAIVDAEQSEAIAAELRSAGYGCDEESEATVCRIEQRGVSLDDVEYSRGETHALRDNAWIATAWLNFSPEGYTEDILSTLWT